MLKSAAELYGVARGYSMTRFEELAAVRELLGEWVRFIAMPGYRGGDLLAEIGPLLIDRLPGLRFGIDASKL